MRRRLILALLALLFPLTLGSIVYKRGYPDGCVGDTGVVYKRGNCPATASGGTAPGVSEGVGDTQTFLWVGSRESVPFPEHIDEGQWTDLYFSSEATGWPEGDDLNDGSSTDEALHSISEWRSRCVSPFVRCIADPLDDWTSADGADTVIGALTDADIDNTGCPSSSNFAANREQPCFWWILTDGLGNHATFDFRGVTGGASMDFRPVTDRSHLLIDGGHWIGTDGGAGTPPVDLHESGMISVVNATLEYGGNPSGTGNLFSAHDVGAFWAYNVEGDYLGTGGAGNPMFGANVSSSISVHTPHTLTGCVGCDGVNLNQFTGTPDASLEAEAIATPAEMLVTGAKLAADGTGVSNDSFMLVRATDQDALGNQRSAHARATFISVAFEPAEQTGWLVQSADSSAAINDVAIFLSTVLWSGETTRLLQGATATVTPGSQIIAKIVGSVPELSRIATVNQANWVRNLDADWAGTESVLTVIDSFHSNDPTYFRATDGVNNCFSTTPAAFETCVETTQAWDPTLTFTNFVEPAADTSGTVLLPAADGFSVTGTPWTTDQWVDALVVIQKGTSGAESCIVESNTTSALTCTAAWAQALTIGDTYEIIRYVDRDGYCLPGGACEGHNTGGVQADYTSTLGERVQVPAFMAGETLHTWSEDPANAPNAGRQPAE